MLQHRALEERALRKALQGSGGHAGRVWNGWPVPFACCLVDTKQRCLVEQMPTHLDTLHNGLVQRLADGAVLGAAPQERVPERLFGARPLQQDGRSRTKHVMRRMQRLISSASCEIQCAGMAAGQLPAAASPQVPSPRRRHPNFPSQAHLERVFD